MGVQVVNISPHYVKQVKENSNPKCCFYMFHSTCHFVSFIHLFHFICFILFSMLDCI